MFRNCRRYILPLFIMHSMFSLQVFAQSTGYNLTVVPTKKSLLKIYAEPKEGGESIPLLDHDSSSSVWFFLVNGEKINPLESGWARTDVSGDSRQGYKNSFSSEKYAITQNVKINAEKTQSLYTLLFTNNEDKPVVIQPVIILDTVLGEKDGTPFFLPDGIPVTGDTRITGDAVPVFIDTMNKDLSLNFTVLFDKKNGDYPESVTMSNWLRLLQEGPFIDNFLDRNFDYFPFSRNDGSLQLIYKKRTIQPGESGEIVLVLGFERSISNSSSFDINSFRDTNNSLNIIQQRLREINRALGEADKILLNRDSIQEADILSLERRVSEEAALRNEYENLQP